MIRSLAALALLSTAMPLVQAAERESERLAQARGQAAKLAAVSSFRSAEKADDPGWRTASNGKLRYLASSTAELGWNYYGDRDGGLYLMAAEDEARPIGAPEPGTPVVALVAHRDAPQNVIAQTASATLYMSRDYGLTWQKVKSFEGNPAGNAFPMTYDPLSNEGFLVGDIALYRTRNGGEDWERIVENRGDGAEMARVSAIAMSATEPQVLMAGFTDGSVYTATYAEDHTTVRTAVMSRPRVGMVSSIALSPERATLAYVGYAEFAGTRGNVFLTRSAGTGWEAANAGGSELPDAPVTALKIADDSGNGLFVLNQAGMFVTRDGGTRWMRENLELGNLTPAALTTTASSSGLHVVMATSDGRAAYWSDHDLPCYFTLFEGNNVERWMDMGSQGWPGSRTLKLTSYISSKISKYDCVKNPYIPGMQLIWDSSRKEWKMDKSSHPSFWKMFSDFSFDRLPNSEHNTVSYKVSIHVTKNTTNAWRQRGIFVDRSHIRGGYRGFVVAISQGAPNSDSCQVRTNKVQEQVSTQFCSANHTRYQLFDIGYDNGRCSISSINLVACGNSRETGLPSDNPSPVKSCSATTRSAAVDVYEQPLKVLMGAGTATCRMAAEEPTEG